MPSRDPRSPDAEVRSVEVRREPLEVTHPAGPAQEGQIWALYPVVSNAGRSEAPGFDLLGLLWNAARRGRRALALGALAGFGFGAAYLAVADPLYVVKTLLHVELRKSVIREVDSRIGSGYVGTQAEVIQSPAIVAEAIREIGLPEPGEPGLFDAIRSWLEALNPFPAADPGDPLARAVLATLPALQAWPVVGTDVMTVTLRTVAPERGVRLLDALTARYQAYLRENEAAAHREGIEVLRQREAGLAAQLAELRERSNAQRAETRSLGDGQSAFAVQRMALEGQAMGLVEAQRRRIDLENELLALREMRDARVAPSREIQDELVRAEAALAELRSRVSERHPDVLQMEQRVAGLRDQLRLGAQARIEQLEREARAARRTEAAISGLYDREWQRLKKVEVERSTLDTLESEIAALEEQRRSVLALLGEKELSLLSAQGGENSGTLVRVLEAPAVPLVPVWPLPIPVLVACSMVGLLGGLGFATLRYWREQGQPAAAAPAPFGDVPDYDRFEPAPSRIAARRAP
jgi:uncharacterized protein involved in exopolysaccharide biosynthesis